MARRRIGIIPKGRGRILAPPFTLGAPRPPYYNIYCGQDGAINYETIVAEMELIDTQVAIANQDLPPNTIWHYIRRQVSDCGLESASSGPCIIRIDANGDMLEASPNPPMLLTIEKLADAKFRLRWRYSKLAEEIAPTEFRIYMDSGSGFNFSAPAAVVSYQRLPGGGEYSWISGVLTHGQQYRFCVRSFNEDAGESQNTNFVTAIADSQGPDAITGLRTSWEEI